MFLFARTEKKKKKKKYVIMTTCFVSSNNMVYNHFNTDAVGFKDDNLWGLLIGYNNR